MTNNVQAYAFVVNGARSIAVIFSPVFAALFMSTSSLLLEVFRIICTFRNSEINCLIV